MARPAETRIGKDWINWIVRATRYDHHLSAGAPIYASVNRHARPTSAQMDFHEGIEVGIVLRGDQQRHYENWTMDITRGDVWLCAMWEPHGWRVVSPNTKNVVLIFRPEFLGEQRLGDASWLSLFAMPPRERPRVSDARLRKTVLGIGAELAEEIAGKRDGWLTAVRLSLLQLLFALGRDWRPPAGGGNRAGVRTTNLSRIMPALSLLHDRKPRPVSLSDAAAACGLSRPRFGIIFRQTMGASFGRFSMRARLAFAAHELLTTDLAAEAIARQAGFVDGSHFHRTFVKHYSCTPRAYRERGASDIHSET